MVPNARDPSAGAATLNYPHRAFASKEIKVDNTTADFARDTTDYLKGMAALAPKPLGNDAGHPKRLGQDGDWGVQARSSFAP